jgi:hypothetical protein
MSLKKVKMEQALEITNCNLLEDNRYMTYDKFSSADAGDAGSAGGSIAEGIGSLVSLGSQIVQKKKAKKQAKLEAQQAKAQEAKAKSDALKKQKLQKKAFVKPKEKKSNTGLIIGISVLVLASAGAGIYFLTRKKTA